MDYQTRMGQYEAGIALEEYKPGDALRLLAGMFEGHEATFRRIIEGGDIPMIEADLSGVAILGRTVTITVDPINARRLARE